MKRYNLCRPCLEDMKSEGKVLRLVKAGVNSKVSCDRCQRRRFGAAYELEVQRKRKAKA